ncbi:MlaD family protein [Roseomonas sp. CCTCC AB2023176]|uniref:MlaD family protein n=1 Tax=Roseomonas sp. CCTCC AB2023176 TaxID=3342640 RepID=UPI0035DD3F10
MAATSRSLYLRVGMLILAAIALGVGFVLFFTANRLTRNATIYETYLRESVQGLEVGAPVRFRGVRLGQVTEISLVSIEYPPPSAAGVLQDQAYRRVLIRFAVDLSRFRELPSTEMAVENGLRVRLSSTGITGVSYLELDFVEPSRYPVEPPPWEPRYAVVPSQPSTVSQVTSAAEQLVQRVMDAPIEAILRDAAGLLSDLRGQVNDGELNRTLREVNETVVALRGAIQDAQLGALGAELRGAVTDLRAVLGGPEIRGTLRSANAALDSARVGLDRLPAAIAAVERAARAVNLAVADINGDLTPTLRDLRGAAGSLRDTTEGLRRAPAASLLAPSAPAPEWARGNGREARR